jgi:hypothetical protein
MSRRAKIAACKQNKGKDNNIKNAVESVVVAVVEAAALVLTAAVVDDASSDSVFLNAMMRSIGGPSTSEHAW